MDDHVAPEVWGLGYGVSCFVFHVSCFGVLVSGFVLRVSCLGFRVSGFGLRASGVGLMKMMESGRPDAIIVSFRLSSSSTYFALFSGTNSVPLHP